MGTMLEKRTMLVNIAREYIGCTEGDKKYIEMLKIYNEKNTYKINAKDPWGAVLISAITIQAGLDNLLPVACNCAEHMRLSKDKGIFKNKNNHIPVCGDIVYFGRYGYGKPHQLGIIVKTIKENKLYIIMGNYNVYLSKPHTTIKIYSPNSDHIIGYAHI